MLSRMKDFWNTVFRDENGQLKQGHEYQTLHDMYNSPEMGIILLLCQRLILSKIYLWTTLAI